MSVFDFPSGTLCLDLANTWGDRSDTANDTLHGYSDVLEWAREAGVVDDEGSSRLEAQIEGEPEEASKVFGSVVAVREAVYRMSSAIAAGESPDRADIDVLNTFLESMPPRRLCCGGECCEWERPVGNTDLRMVLWPVVESAAELLTSPAASRIRECNAPDCNWLFLDHSRGGRRRWCDMGTCGNRAKARRYYERHRLKR
jgi:predicted RNA-binding Zn ribbon-like protein